MCLKTFIWCREKLFRETSTVSSSFLCGGTRLPLKSCQYFFDLFSACLIVICAHFLLFYIQQQHQCGKFTKICLQSFVAKNSENSLNHDCLHIPKEILLDKILSRQGLVSPTPPLTTV